MPRYHLIIEYDGEPFVGWQQQQNGVAVQARLQEALARFTAETPIVIAAGRTDAGVHALGQSIHFDLEHEWEVFRLTEALNFHLKPDPIAIVSGRIAPPDFNSRLDAIERRYLYRIINRRAPLAIQRGLAYAVTAPLDARAMHEAAQCLVGKHDFTSFRSVYCQAKSPLKTLLALDVARENDEITIRARAPSFLHHQVRNFVGTLLLVGLGKWKTADVTAALAAKDRSAAGPTAPPQGLYLVEVCYPPNRAIIDDP